MTAAPAIPSSARWHLSALGRWIVLLLGAIAVTAGVVFTSAGNPDALLGTAVLYTALVTVWLAIIDFRTHRLPNWLILPSYGVLVALLAIYVLGTGDWGALGRASAAAAITGLTYYGLALWAGLGLGDVKLGALLGLMLGWGGLGPALAGPVLAFIGGAVAAGVLLVAGRARDSRVAFGPFLVAGALVALVPVVLG